MILIVVKFRPKPEHVDEWPALMRRDAGPGLVSDDRDRGSSERMTHALGSAASPIADRDDWMLTVSRHWNLDRDDRR